MKTIIKLFLSVIIFSIFNNISLSQEWAGTYVGYNTGVVNTGNPNVLYAFAYNIGFTHLYKTTNKGINWNEVHEFQANIALGQQPISYFIDEYTGWFAYPIDYNNTFFIFKTTDGGSNFTQVFSQVSFDAKKIVFTDANTGYLIRNANLEVYKTTNGGTTWTKKYNNDGSNRFMEDIDISKSDNSKIYVAGIIGTGTNEKPVLLKSSDGFDNVTEVYDGSSDPDQTKGIYSISVVGTTDQVRFCSFYNGIYSYDNSTGDVTQLNSISDIRKIEFSPTNTSLGYALSSGGAYYTSNGGSNWTLESSTSNTSNAKPVAFNHAAYKGGNGYIYTRLFPATFNTYFDGTSGSGSLYFDGVSYSSPSSQNVRGGYSDISANLTLSNTSMSNTEAIFYKWNSGLLYYYRNDELYTSPTSINANYKTKKYSTSGTSINNTAQRRSFRDQFGQVNTIHESMGGVFFTKSTDNGATFITEEVVNDNARFDQYATEGPNNANSFVSEIVMRSDLGGPISRDKTPVAVWENKNGETIKINVSNRRRNNDESYTWIMDDDLSFQITGVTNPNFRAFPKVFSTITSYSIQNIGNRMDSIYSYMSIIPYLAPATSGSKIMLRCKIGSSVDTYEIESGNISDLSVDVVRSSMNLVYDLHMTYKKDNKIYYRKETLEYCTGASTKVCLTTTNNQLFEVSSTDGLASRWTPDISLRNGLPIVVYKGARTVQHVINWDGAGGGLPDVLEISKSPIYVRKKNSQGGWDNFQSYESPGTSTQENPDIEASVDANAHLVGFSRNNSTFYKFVQIDGLSGYQCDPQTFSGNDAKFVKGSYTGQTGGTSYPMLWTSKSENSLYKIDKQSFTISNQITASDAYSNLAGVIGMDGVDYRFTLGPIFVKNTIEIEKDVFVNITTPAEFNEQMKTSPFYLDNGDTLILGAQGSYLLADEEGTFTDIRYDVNLIRKSDSSVQRILFKDTVHVEDSVESVYLRGYVIDSLSAADSFFVQLVVNEDDLNDGDYTLNGVYMGEGSEEDSYGYKTMVYFEGDNPFNGNHSTLPKEYALHQNYPNPFNPSTTISYDLPKDGLVRMKVYDIAGREVMTLVNEVKTAGRYTASFNGSSFSSGVYFYRIEAGDFVQTKRMVLVK